MMYLEDVWALRLEMLMTNWQNQIAYMRKITSHHCWSQRTIETRLHWSCRKCTRVSEQEGGWQIMQFLWNKAGLYKFLCAILYTHACCVIFLYKNDFIKLNSPLPFQMLTKTKWNGVVSICPNNIKASCNSPYRWKLLDFAELKRSYISFFDIGKPEIAVSCWSRARTRAAKVSFKQFGAWLKNIAQLYMVLNCWIFFLAGGKRLM